MRDCKKLTLDPPYKPKQLSTIQTSQNKLSDLLTNWDQYQDASSDASYTVFE